MAIAGFAVGAIGLVVSAAAFIVAVWQIRKTQTAAENAAKAAREARDVVRHVSVVSDLSQISVQIELIKELHRNEEWTRAIDRYSPLRRVLTDARSTLSDELDAIFTFAIIQLQLMERRVDVSFADQIPIPFAELNDDLTHLQQLLDEVRVELQRNLANASGTGADNYDND